MGIQIKGKTPSKPATTKSGKSEKPIPLSKTPAKVARKRRGEAAIMGADPFEYLLNRFINAKSTDVKDRLALELMPYVKPKLKSVDMHQTGDFVVTVTIGGEGTAPEKPDEADADF